MRSRVLIFGDSITWGAVDEQGGWAQRLKNYFHRKELDKPGFDNPIYPLGVSGDTTEELLMRFENETRMRRDSGLPLTIVFAIGINDSQIENGENRVPKDIFISNMQKLIILAHTYAKQIVIVGLTPINETQMKKYMITGYSKKKVEDYDRLLQQVARRSNVPFFPLLPAFQKVDLKEVLYDGLHPNSKGHLMIFQTVLANLKKHGLV